MTKKEIAINNFKSGCNCAQAVVLAYKEELNLDEKTLLKLASPFGGGMGGLREVCGAVSGALMVLGLLDGYDKLNDISIKKNLYSKANLVATKFKEKTGSYICRELLRNTEISATPSERNANYYAKRVACVECVGIATEVLEEILSDMKV